MTLKALRMLFVAATLGAPAAALAAPSPAPAFGPEDRAAVERASSFFNGVTDMQGDFVQVGPNGERTTGKFYYSRPGRIRFDYAKPMMLQVLADGTTLAVRDTQKNTQDVLPLSQTPLRFILADKVDLLRDARVIAVERMNDVTTIVLEDKSALAQGRLSVVFDGPEFKLRQWTITDAQGLDTTVALYNVETGKKLAPSTFTIRMERMLMPSSQ